MMFLCKLSKNMLIKPKKDIELLKKNGRLMGEILAKLEKMVRPGISTGEIDIAAEKMILAAGGVPAFKGFSSHPSETPFPTTICASINHEVVHGIAKPNVFLKDGDIFSIDIGMEWPKKKPKDHGTFSDTAITVPVGKINNKVKELLRVTKESLEIGIRAAQPGKSVAGIGKAIEEYVKSQGNYGIIRDLVGHGVGHEVHEEPRVPNYYDRRLESFILKPGMVIAIEPMISMGGHQIRTGKDGWVIEMSDCSLCAHFEHTVIITEKGPVVATRRPSEKN